MSTGPRRAPYKLEILFTPWGEALIRRHYRDAMTRLSHVANVETVAIQTNLSCGTGWVRDCDLGTAAFWTTYHPGQVSLDVFVGKILRLEALGARYSVGVVGCHEHLAEIERLRQALPDGCYLWVNADRSLPAAELLGSGLYDRLTGIDPLFPLNAISYPSRGSPCRAGEDSISVGPDGTASRCHFVKRPIGNIFDPGFEDCLRPRRCPARRCDCHIGYSQIEALDLRGLFGPGFVERRAPTGTTSEAAQTRLRRLGLGPYQVSRIGR